MSRMELTSQTIEVADQGTGSIVSGGGLLLTVGLAGAVGIAISGGVQSTNAYPTSAFDGKAKAVAYVVVGGKPQLAKVQKAPDTAGAGSAWAADLNWIRSHADVTVSRLAEVFGVTRKAFYGWADGASPKKGGSQKRIAVLRALLEGLPTDDHRTVFFGLLDLPGRDGDSFRSLFLRSTDETDYRRRLNEKVAELADSLEAAAQRAKRGAPVTRAFEAEF